MSTPIIGAQFLFMHCITKQSEDRCALGPTYEATPTHDYQLKHSAIRYSNRQNSIITEFVCSFHQIYKRIEEIKPKRKELEAECSRSQVSCGAALRR